MIARHWRGWTTPENADAYEDLLQKQILPEIEKIEGHCGGYLLRKEGPDEVEFIVLNFFDSLDAVKRFAGPDYSVAVFEPEALALLCRVEPTASHYELRRGGGSAAGSK
jgi:heme-degrading monooxygenase HmoA